MARGTDCPRIFQIGFNRCGTVSIFRFFENNGLKAIHWGQGSLAAGIEAAYLEEKPLLTYVDGYDVYCDMEFMREDHAGEWFSKQPFRRLYANLHEERLSKPIYAFERFRELDQQYPGSRFILNIRDTDNWVRSRNKFLDRGYFFCVHGDSIHANQKTLDECWKHHWDMHLAAVREYFLNRPEALLEFDIEQDDPRKMVAFFDDLEMDASHWGRYNKSDEKPGGFIQSQWVPFDNE